MQYKQWFLSPGQGEVYHFGSVGKSTALWNLGSRVQSLARDITLLNFLSVAMSTQILSHQPPVITNEKMVLKAAQWENSSYNQCSQNNAGHTEMACVK